MAKTPPTEFVGEPGPGAVIDQYLPQPGHHVGRRILRIDDIPDDCWRDEAAARGTPWSEALGLVARGDAWEIDRPERLIRTWFARRARIPHGGGRKTLRVAQAALHESARETLAQQGTLRNWPRASTMAKTYDYDPDTDTTTADTTSGSVPSTDEKPHGRKPPADDADDVAIDFHDAISDIITGQLELPTPTWGGGTTTVPVDPAAPPQPMLFIVQVIGISAFLGDYGLGRTVKTFTLLPGETTTISTRTWRASSESVEQASSIIDSYTESASDRFAETVMTETTDTATRSQTENWHAEAAVSGSFGFGSASVSGGGGGEYSSSTEEFAKAVDESVREHAAESSSHRENTVTSNSERTSSAEDEEVIERTISNINVRRVLNFVFRELNQVYVTKTHLKDVRIAFSNGNAGSWREEPISGLRRLVEEVVAPQHVAQVCQDLLRTIALVFDANDVPVPVLEAVRLDACGTEVTIAEARPNQKCLLPPPTADGRLYYRFRRGPLAQDADEPHPVDGVMLKQREVVMATDSVVVEALLGQSDALDAYSQELQVEAIREKQLANLREAMAHQIVGSKDTDASAIYAQLFVPAPDTTP